MSEFGRKFTFAPGLERRHQGFVSGSKLVASSITPLMKGASPRHGDAANENEYGDRADDQKEQRRDVSKDLPHHCHSRVDREHGTARDTDLWFHAEGWNARHGSSGVVNKTFQPRRFVPPDEAGHAHPVPPTVPGGEDGG